MKILDFRLEFREKVRDFEKFILEGGQGFQEDLEYEEWFQMFMEFCND